LHFSIEHLAFNLLAWLIYAGRVERQLGSRFLLGFLFVTAVSSNLLQWWVIGPNFGGLSGVCFALFGFAWVYGMRYPQQVLKAERSDVVVSVIFLGLGFADLLWVNTANYAHLGGLIVGLLLALFPFKPAKSMTS
jgi:GlpG protein